ncbi:unnamed protein product, partial [Allacma fusca]
MWGALCFLFAGAFVSLVLPLLRVLDLSTLAGDLFALALRPAAVLVTRPLSTLPFAVDVLLACAFGFALSLPFACALFGFLGGAGGAEDAAAASELLVTLVVVAAASEFLDVRWNSDVEIFTGDEGFFTTLALPMVAEYRTQLRVDDGPNQTPSNQSHQSLPAPIGRPKLRSPFNSYTIPR